MLIKQVLSGGIVHTQCIPVNDTLSGSLMTPVRALLGAFGGLIPLIVVVISMVVMGAILFALRSDKAQAWMKTLAWILIAPIAIILLLSIWGTLWSAFNGQFSC